MPVVANLRGDPQLEREKLWDEFCERHDALRKQYKHLFKSVTARWHEAASRKNFLELEEVQKLPKYLTESNYVDSMRTLLKMDEAHRAIEMRRFDLIGHKLEIRILNTLKGSFKYFKVEGLADGQPKLIVGDHVIMRDQSGRSEEFKIEEIIDDWISIPEQLAMRKKFLTRELNLSFVSSGLLYNLYERALRHFMMNSITECRIFKSSRLERPTFDLERAPRAEKRLCKLDEYQRQAVSMILCAKCYPKPYIVNGPPGTGKSHTLAEAIVQIYARKPDCRILTCANSNTCADQMFTKLKAINIIPKRDIVRLSAGEKATSIGTSRIVVTTNMKSASFIGKLRSISFDYVIIDEAGHSHEPETLVPISCLKPFGCLVLAGDPKQLGPVAQCDETMCDHLKKYGLDKSMLERISKFNIYQPDKKTGRFDPEYITELLISYRCDPRVLSISNELFYNRKLHCVNETPMSLLRMMSITNPLQLLFVRGQEEQPKSSTSWYNEMEADMCVDLILLLYKMGIKPDQVGVISPYKLQAKRIEKKLLDRLKPVWPLLERLSRELEHLTQARREHNSNIPVAKFDEVKPKLNKQLEDSLIRVLSCERVGEEIERRWLCKIDSVDAYQGDERDIIIISTVRTPSERGKKFIDEPRRFNVAMSRARWMKIVIGDKEVLSGLRRWGEFTQSSSEELANYSKQSTSKAAFKSIISKLESTNADLRNRQ